MPSKTLKIILIASSIFLSGCATIYNPVTGIEEMAFVDTATEVSMGQRMAWEVAREFPISRDPAEKRRLDEIGGSIARVSDRKDLEYNFYVIRRKAINAFTIPGGFIYVFSGLMDMVDDDELAVVLAHEVGHVAARHPAKKMEVNMGYELLDSLIFGRSSEAEMRRAMNIFFNIVAAGYERGDELMADNLSIKYTKMAGYDPAAAIRFMKKLQAYEQRRGSPAYTILSSHPPLEDRIMNAEAELKKLAEKDSEPAPAPSLRTREAGEERVEKTQSRPRYGNIKICPECGKEYPLNFNYCTRDGTKLES